MPHIAEQQRGWDTEHSVSVAEAIREAMDDASPVKRSKSMRGARYQPHPSVKTPRDLPAPAEPHLPLRKASAQSRLQGRKGSVPQPLFAPSQHHRLRGFNPSPVEPPLPRIDNITASSEHAFAPREMRKRFQPALSTLENQQISLQYDERSPTFSTNGSRPPSSPMMPSPMSPLSPPNQSKPLKGSKSVGDGLRGMRHGRSEKQRMTSGRLTPESVTRPSIPAASDEVRESFRSALTSHSSYGHASSINTYATSASGRSTPNSFVKLRRGDWDDAGVSDVEMSVEDAIGMYEDGFSSVPNSARGSFDLRPIRSKPGGLTPEVRSIRSARSFQLERPASQPEPSQSAPTVASRPSTPTRDRSKRPKVSHRRSQSASILLGASRTENPSVSPSATLRVPAPDGAKSKRTTFDIACNNKATDPPGALPRDRYGFKKATQYVTVEQYDEWDKYYSRHIDRRTKKWRAMMKSYGMATDPPIRFPPKSEKIKRYVRKGIPPDFRGAAWFWYAGGPGKLAREPDLYWQLCEKAKPENGFLSDSDREHIERDLNRTFPDNVRFKPDPSDLHDAQAGAGGGSASPENNKKRNRQTQDPEMPILQALRRVLQAFAIHNPNIGYCQSLNFIAGLLLLFLDEDEEKAFVLLDVVTTEHLPSTHGIALEGANIDIAVLMSCVKDTIPAVWAKLDDKGGSHGVGGLATAIGGAGALRLPTVSLATTAWFMSLFVGTLPIESVLRVWDCLFFEGSKTLFRIALSIFKLGEAQIVTVSDPMEIFQLVQTIPRSMLDVNGLMEVCFRRRGGFGGVSQGVIEKRRAERREIVKEGVAREADDGGLLKFRGRLRRTTIKG